jgi:predicted acylesterase/phospholipase RssA
VAVVLAAGGLVGTSAGSLVAAGLAGGLSALDLRAAVQRPWAVRPFAVASSLLPAGAPVADVGTAVAASCAIPAYFSPVQVDGVAYVDGGVHSPSNADVVARDRPDLVVVLSPMTMARGTARQPPRLVELLARA